jgi:cytochrome c-type biogenesis protein
MEEISLLAAFTAGLISFLSPCILPLIPAYLSFISELSIQELQQGKAQRKGIALSVFFDAFFFVLGFSVIFVALGASATFLGQFLIARMFLLKKLSGLLIILFGLHTMGIFRIRFLDVEKRYHQKKKTMGLLGSFLIGLAFAFGWTPCIGPILAAILVYAGTKKTIFEGIVLLSIYSAGLGIPFLIAAVGMETFLGFSNLLKRHFRTVEIISGVLLIFVGILVLSNDLSRINSLLMKALGGLPSGEG